MNNQVFLFIDRLNDKVCLDVDWPVTTRLVFGPVIEQTDAVECDFCCLQ